MGYFLWKPFLISAKLHELSENEFLIYSDAGCEIVLDKNQDLIDSLPTEPNMDLSAVPLEPFHTTGRWTNSYCLSQVRNAETYLNLPQISAACLFIRNTSASKTLVQRWLELSTVEDYSCLVDRPGDLEGDVFEQHRWDQSIFSLLAYDFDRHRRIGLKRIDIERARGPNSSIRGVRNRTPFQSINTNKYSFIAQSYKQKLLSKCYSAGVKLFWNEEKYRADLYDSLRNEPRSKTG
jgi:hypothetical protein